MLLHNTLVDYNITLWFGSTQKKLNPQACSNLNCASFSKVIPFTIPSKYHNWVFYFTLLVVLFSRKMKLYIFPPSLKYSSIKFWCTCSFLPIFFDFFCDCIYYSIFCILLYFIFCFLWTDLEFHTCHYLRLGFW